MHAPDVTAPRAVDVSEFLVPPSTLLVRIMVFFSDSNLDAITPRRVPLTHPQAIRWNAQSCKLRYTVDATAFAFTGALTRAYTHGLRHTRQHVTARLAPATQISRKLTPLSPLPLAPLQAALTSPASSLAAAPWYELGETIAQRTRWRGVWGPNDA